MQLDLTRVRQPLTHISRTFRPEEVAQEGDAYRIAGPVHLELDVHKDKETFRLSGTARTELELPCSRCLEPFGMPVEVVFDLKYLPAARMATDEEREVQDEDFETSYYRDDRIDVNELLREQFYLQLPMKPLCREECQGLCPECGTNRNTGTCDCAPAWEDPRMASLRGLTRSKRES
jgi:uncharacterized protein